MRNKADITSLPNELITHILSHLTDERDLMNAHQSNTLFATILENKTLPIFKKIYCKIFQRHYMEIEYAPFFVGIQNPSPNWIDLYHQLPEKLKKEVMMAKTLEEFYSVKYETDSRLSQSALEHLIMSKNLAEPIYAPKNSDIFLALALNKKEIIQYKLISLTTFSTNRPQQQTNWSEYAIAYNSEKTLNELIKKAMSTEKEPNNAIYRAIQHDDAETVTLFMNNSPIFENTREKLKDLLKIWKESLIERNATRSRHFFVRKDARLEKEEENKYDISRYLMYRFFVNPNAEDMQFKFNWFNWNNDCSLSERLFVVNADSTLKKNSTLGILYRNLQKTIPNNNLPDIDSWINYLYFSWPTSMPHEPPNAESLGGRALAIIFSSLINLSCYILLPFFWSLALIFCSLFFGFDSIYDTSHILSTSYQPSKTVYSIAWNIESKISETLVYGLIGNHICFNFFEKRMIMLDFVFIFPLFFILSSSILSNKMPWYHPLRMVSELVRALLYLPYGILRSVEFFIIKLIAATIVLLAIPGILAYKATVAISDYSAAFFITAPGATETDNPSHDALAKGANQHA